MATLITDNGLDPAARSELTAVLKLIVVDPTNPLDLEPELAAGAGRRQ
ncbi:MAG: hypothetical protein M3253_02890 [Chloroflexota bacterium]|nr:hypothetical protein [Chloroflexota bacterium]